jgi:hypothetical protein
MSSFRRPLHEEVIEQLKLLDAAFLAQCACYFGGGTRIVLELGEYRESRDIDFLCADTAGYRRVRETISETSLGAIASGRLRLAREVRSDQFGVRTRMGSGDAALKFEIVREARIGLSGTKVKGIPVACLDRSSCFAEKFLANADRGLDRSTLSRDLVDLAFMVQSWPDDDRDAGYETACGAYGSEVPRKLAAALLGFQERAHRARCIEGLAISDAGTLAKGLKRLASFSAASPGRP